MKIMATFDGSVLSESIFPQLETLCALPNAELVLLRVSAQPHSQLRTELGPPVTAVSPTGGGGTGIVVNLPATEYAETKEQAVERIKAELHDYLHAIVQRLPAGIPCRVETIIDDHPQSAIVRFAITEDPDLIVMATHGHTGLVHVLFGDVAESVVRSGVAPVLLVHPRAISQSRSAIGTSEA
jgi:nucleotide-binding universal stress UspA family protein